MSELTAENIDHAFSETQGDFALAMSIVQGEVRNPKKTSDNPFFKSKYADLAECIDACRASLSRNQIAVLQLTIVRGDRAGCITRLVHSSGQWVQCTTLLRPEKDTPQSMGSAFTYARRYALSGLIGLAGDDDDGHAASEPKEEARTSVRPEQRQTKTKTKEQDVVEESDLYRKYVKAPFMKDIFASPNFAEVWGSLNNVKAWVISQNIGGFKLWDDEVKVSTNDEKLNLVMAAIREEHKRRSTPE